ncbi:MULTISPECIES: DNA polymerase subunit beta [unclassified Methanoculleus]|uniref:DNA polymerase subunit beta n=1 Tax=unclassified Methanoculleus TaxID=2619537 RepID=UPI0025FD80E9|nr:MULTISPECIES: DNA polymerase subunit beta [unclassified Methanoculleus]MCK9317695.1 DNA polymerase subunit beta [Methanoculleus sp.]MDD2253793.1 DNA polymerase subunit beta [Methanoculleus sp.]MDD2787488.1 DNA polymerase subunit beta [Methanoculleus sp.]MDD3216338.1 DNA polymerase subunit beta [Methanoculleus sp.]MDD4313923.1 DNA polymerase subunit beta [Methanoculleus sp.]
MTSIRLRDFIEDREGCIYAVSNYDNTDRVGCILRYVPDADGERTGITGRRYRKYDFAESFAWIREHKPEYLDAVHRVPCCDVVRVYKPEEEIGKVAARNARVRRLLSRFDLPTGSFGCTGSLLCGLENAASDIDLVVYGDAWFAAQRQLRHLVGAGVIPGMSTAMWRKVYDKRVPEISFEAFVLHEQRKWNRGEFEGTYFDLLYTRAYGNLDAVPAGKGTVLGRATIEATVTDASLSFDSPAVYAVDHDDVSRVLSFTHTYSGQALAGEVIEAKGVVEEHGDERWLIVGTTREAKGEYIVSKTLLESV